MTKDTRRGTLLAAILAPLGLNLGWTGPVLAKGERGGPGTAAELAVGWFARMAEGQLDERTHPAIVLVLHGAGAGLDGTPERFEGREAVTAVLAGSGPAQWDVEDVLGDGPRAALRGTMRLPGGRSAVFAAFVTVRDGKVARVERHLDRVQQVTAAG